jgi:hypothetical protein
MEQRIVLIKIIAIVTRHFDLRQVDIRCGQVVDQESPATDGVDITVHRIIGDEKTPAYVLRVVKSIAV